jgi:hypothetical protein
MMGISKGNDRASTKNVGITGKPVVEQTAHCPWRRNILGLEAQLAPHGTDCRASQGGSMPQ